MFKGIDASTILVQMAVFAMAVFRLMPSMNRLQVALNILMFYVPSINVVYRDLQNTKLLKYTEIEENKNINFDKNIKVNNVSFKYQNTKNYIFKNISFEIKKGSSIGFVGPTGVGKTTIIDIILGLLNPTEGNITVDEVDIHKNKKSWFSKIGYVPQFIYLTDDILQDEGAVKQVARIICQPNGGPALHSGSIADVILRKFFEGEQITLDTVIELPNRNNHTVGEYVSEVDL